MIELIFILLITFQKIINILNVNIHYDFKKLMIKNVDKNVLSGIAPQSILSLDLAFLSINLAPKLALGKIINIILFFIY